MRFMLILLYLLFNFFSQVSFLRYWMIHNDCSAFKHLPINLFDCFHALSLGAKLYKCESSWSFFIRVLRNIYLYDCPKGSQQLTDMFLVDVENQIANNNSMSFHSFYFIFDRLSFHLCFWNRSSDEWFVSFCIRLSYELCFYDWLFFELGLEFYSYVFSFWYNLSSLVL